MSDLLSSLKQLQKTREEENPVPSIETEIPVTEKMEDSSTNPVDRSSPVMLSGRVPLAVHKRFKRSLDDVADELRVRRVNLDEALEAALRAVMQDPEARKAWVAELQAVRREKREG